MMPALREAFEQQRTRIFAHRGASAYAPMNTLPAFERAVELGADGVELDVQLSADGEAVIVHDFTVDGTTDGHGKVRHLTLAQLKKLDAGLWFGKEFRHTRIPTLDEVFDAVGDRLFINIELKTASLTGDGLEAVVAGRIRRARMQERVLVSSFNAFALRRFRRALPEVAIGFLHHPAHVRYMRWLMVGLRHEARHPHHSLIDPSYMAWARRTHYWVNTWTVNDAQRAVELRDLGVDTLMTDCPDVIRVALRG